MVLRLLLRCIYSGIFNFLAESFCWRYVYEFYKSPKSSDIFFWRYLITEDQLNWIEVQKMIIRAEPNFNARTVPPQYNWRKPIHQFVTSTGFEIFIAVIILANMLQMAMLYEGASDSIHTRVGYN